MRYRMAFCLWASLLTAAPAATAEEPTRLDRLEERFNELEARYERDIKARDALIDDLRARLDRQQADRAGLQKEKNDILSRIDADEPPPFSLRVPASFNPDLAVVSDFLGALSSRSNDALNRVDVREVELDLRAAVHPRADAVVILAFERHAHHPVFPADEEEDEGLETGVNVEEAYLLIHDTGVPNLTAKLGRFHLRFGRQNLLHQHDLPTSDPPLVSQSFLAPEALVDSGLSLSYVIPPALIGNQYVEFIAELVSGEGADSESPTLGGDLEIDSPALNLHALWNTDLGANWNLEIGGSALLGHADADNSRDVRLYGADVTLLRRDPTGGFDNQLFQAEFIAGEVGLEDGPMARALGAYFLAQQQLNRDWYTGIRLDWTQDALDPGTEAWAVSPYLSWYWSEFLRFRLQYQHRAGDVPTENILFLQATWVFGAHPPHPYWTMK